MRKLCLAVGISDAPPLDFLPGAANGARAVAQWATASGYETRLLTDEDEPVGIETIRDALVGRPAAPGRAAEPGLLRKGEEVGRLLIYFAGHGLARDAEEDLWLVSRWHAEERAVAVGGLRRKLERFGIAQIVILADACRSAGTDQKSADLTADKVLGAGPLDANLPKADIFKASTRFRAAYMIPGETMEEDRCIFSGVLIEALWGHHDQAFATTRIPRCITSGSLAAFLEAAVPRQAAVYGVTLQPDITTGLREGADIYVGEVPAGAPTLPPWPAPGPTSKMGLEVRSQAGGERGWSTRQSAGAEPSAERSILGGALGGLLKGAMDIAFPSPFAEGLEPVPELAQIVAHDQAVVAEARDTRAARADALRDRYAAEDERPTHFETGAGFSIAGGRARTVRLGKVAKGEDERDRSWWRVAPPDNGPARPYWDGGRLQAPVPLLIELEDGRWVGAAALPEFVATFTIGEQGSASVIYRGMNDVGSNEATEAAIAALQAGTLTVDTAVELAIRVRDANIADPILGIIAAYLFEARADIDSVRQLAFFDAAAGQAIPYDVALLGRLPVVRDATGLLIATVPPVDARSPRSDAERDGGWMQLSTPETQAPVAGAFPWLRQGWAQLDDDDPIALRGLADLIPHLGPAPFTTLNAAGGARLGQIIFEGGA